MRLNLGLRSVDRLDDDDSVHKHTTNANSRISRQYDRLIR